MASNDGTINISGIKTLQICDEGVGPDNVKGGDTKDLLRIVLAGPLENLRCDGNSRIDWIRNDGYACLRANFSASLGQVGHNGGIGIEQVVTSHSGFARDSGRNDNDFHALQRGLELVFTDETCHDAFGLTMAQVSGDSGSMNDVIQVQLANGWVQLQQE